jgi:hypothetical protein
MQSLGDVVLGFRQSKGTKFTPTRNTLPERDMLLTTEHGIELGLRRENDLEQLFTVRVCVAQEPYLFKQLRCEQVCFVDHKNCGAPSPLRLKQHLLQRRESARLAG